MWPKSPRRLQIIALGLLFLGSPCNLAVGSSSIAPESAGGSSRHFLGNKSRHCPAIVPPAAAVHPCHYLWVE